MKSQEYRLIIINTGKIIIVDKNKRSYVSTCHKEDTFDFSIGAKLAEKKNGKQLSYEQEIDILKKEIKNKSEIAEKYSYKEEYALEFRTEAYILSKYLPQYISVEETKVIVTRVLAENQLSMKKDFKKASELTMAGRTDIDKSIVSKILQGKLV